MSVNKMLNAMRGEEDINPENKNSRRKYSYHSVTGKYCITILVDTSLCFQCIQRYYWYTSKATNSH